MSAPARLQSSLNRRLTAQDASFLYNESFHGPQHIGSISFVEGRITYEDIARQIGERLHLIPRYRQRLNFVPFNLNHATWEDDPTFDLKNHIFAHTLSSASEEEVTARAIELHEPALDRTKPLWEMHIVNGMADGRTCILWKVHHCMVDGVSGVELSTVVMDFEPEPPPVAPPDEEWTPQPAPQVDLAFSDALLDLAQSQIEQARRQQEISRRQNVVAERTQMFTQAQRVMTEMATRPIVSAPWNQFPVSRRRSLAWTRLPFGEVRGIRGVLGGTVNDVVLAILSEGAGRYLRERGYNLAGQNLRLGCPVNVRKEDESGALGNRVSMMFPTLPAEPMDPVARLQAVRTETERIKAGREPQALELLMESSSESAQPSVTAANAAATNSAMDAFVNFTTSFPQIPAFTLPQLPAPAALQAPAFGINFVATNVPGVQVPQYIAGKRIQDTIGLMLLSGTMGYGVAIGSYNQQLYIGMMAEPRVFPDVANMKMHVDAAYEDLKQAALAESEKAAAA